MKCQGELSIIGAYGGYSKTPAKHAPVVGNSVLNLLINILGSGSKHIQPLPLMPIPSSPTKGLSIISVIGTGNAQSLTLACAGIPKRRAQRKLLKLLKEKSPHKTKRLLFA